MRACGASTVTTPYARWIAVIPTTTARSTPSLSFSRDGARLYGVAGHFNVGERLSAWDVDTGDVLATHADVRNAGYKAYLVQADVENKGRFYRVRLGSYGDYQAALDAKAEFERKVNKIAYVTRL